MLWGAIIAGLAVVISQVISSSANNSAARKAAAQQVQDQKELTRFNQQIGQENWDNTNFAAQREQMQKAGLNIGMMYSGGGGQGMGMTPQGSASKADTFPMDLGQGMGMTLDAAMKKSNIKNIDADTKLKEIEAEQKGGIDLENKEATVTNLKNQAEKWGLEKEGMEYDNAMKKIESNIANETQDSIIKQTEEAAKKLEGEAMSAQAEGRIDQHTQQERIKQIRQDTTEQQLRMSAIKAGLIKTGADTKAVNQTIVKIATEVNLMKQNNMREWDKMSQTDKEIAIKEIIAKAAKDQAEFNTGTGATMKQWTSIVTDVLNAAR